MNKTWVLLILALLFTACATGTTETAVPTPPPPNPHTEKAFIEFCQAAVEGNLDNALQLVTEDIVIIFGPDDGETYYAEHVGHTGVEELLNDFSEWEVYDCTVRRIEINGDEVNLWWTHYSPCFGFKCTASCECSGTMQGDKIHKIVNDCYYEFWDKDTN